MTKFDLIEATVALACINPDVALAVQAKREISRLWEDISKAPYKQLFNPAVPGPAIWEVVRVNREIDAALQIEKATYSGREVLICTHGNRFIQWAAFRALEMSLGMSYLEVQPNISKAVESMVWNILVIVKAQYPDSYPASLFKNATKCRAIGKSLFPG